MTERFANCMLCGRTVRLTKYGMFRRHNSKKAVLCLGSWRHWKAVRFQVTGVVVEVLGE